MKTSIEREIDGQRMPPEPFLRLRQICLVARELESTVQELSAVFGVRVCHRDPDVAQFGLHNAVMPFGDQFLEVVAPMRTGTAAGRFLDRRGGNCGYMVILDSEALPRWRSHVDSIGVRVAAALSVGGYEGMQLHPRDTGGALLEVNSTIGGSDLNGAYWPAGPDWRERVSTERVRGIKNALLADDNPSKLAARWSQILRRPASGFGNRWQVKLDLGGLRFDTASADSREGLFGMHLRVSDRQSIVDCARSLGLPTTGDMVTACGMQFHLTDD